MLILKGFAQNAAYVNNNPGVNHPFGEISSNSLSYAKEKGGYKNNDISRDITIISFQSTRDGTPVIFPATERDKVLTITKEVYDYALSKQGVAITEEDYRVHLVTQHSAIVDQLEIGPLEDSDGTRIPSFINYQIRGQASQITTWFSDSSFQVRYPETEIVVIPPLDRLDDFFKSGQEVQAMIELITSSITVARMQEARGKYPETYKRIDIFDYHDPANPARIVPTDWGTLIYGVAGNNIDAIKDAIIDKIMSNTTHTRDEWATIFPDIFRRNEVTIVPVWDHISIPNMSNSQGMYSPQVKMKDAQDLLVRIANDYPASHVRNNGQIMGFPHRSIAVASIGHVENKDGMYCLQDLWPDWINTNTTQDFNRMEPATREWALQLAYTIAQAETFVEINVIPERLMKVKRGDNLYLTFTVDRVNYLVLCKSSMVDPES